MKSNLDKLYKTSDALEKDGVWMDISDETGFLVRPFSETNPRVKAAMATHYKPFARQIQMNTLDLKKNLEINVRLFVEICLVDWKGVEIDGKQVEFSKELAVPFLCGLPQLFNQLWKHANDYENYREDLGNS